MEIVEQHAIDKLISRVRQRDPGQEKYVLRFIHEWMQAITKVLPIDLYEIEQSIRFVWENKWKMGSLSQTDYREYILEEEIEEFIRGIQSSVKEEWENEKKAQNQKK